MPRLKAAACGHRMHAAEVNGAVDVDNNDGPPKQWPQLTDASHCYPSHEYWFSYCESSVGGRYCGPSRLYISGVSSAFFFILSYLILSYLIYPIVWLTVGTPLQILQPASSTPRRSRLSVVEYSIQGQSTL